MTVLVQSVLTVKRWPNTRRLLKRTTEPGKAMNRSIDRLGPVLTSQRYDPPPVFVPGLKTNLVLQAFEELAKSVPV